MPRCLLLMPGALPEDDRPLSECLEPIVRALGPCRIRLTRAATGPNPEEEWLGLPPSSSRIPQGPLTVAALGAKPPERSVQFHLSLLTADGATGRTFAHEPSQEEEAAILREATRLETSRLRLVPGQKGAHGLVWEDGSLDLGCVEPVPGQALDLLKQLPQGDGEAMLRRLVDDSLNLLSSLEFNQRRIEEGLEPLNLLWPWGPGFPPVMPNLAVQRGQTLRVESISLRLCGLAKLAGWKHGDPFGLGRGTNLRLETLLESALARQASLMVIEELGLFWSQGRAEEAGWLEEEVASRLVVPLVQEIRAGKGSLVVIADGQRGGIALEIGPNADASDAWLTLDQEAFENRRQEKVELYRIAEEVSTVR